MCIYKIKPQRIALVYIYKYLNLSKKKERHEDLMPHLDYVIRMSFPGATLLRYCREVRRSGKF